VPRTSAVGGDTRAQLLTQIIVITGLVVSNS